MFVYSAECVERVKRKGKGKLEERKLTGIKMREKENGGKRARNRDLEKSLKRRKHSKERKEEKK